MKQVVHSILTLLLFTIILISCSSDPIEPIDNDDDDTTGGGTITQVDEILPLSSGLFWKYKWYQLDEFGHELQQISENETRIIGTQTVEAGEEIYDSFVWARVDPASGQTDEIKWLFKNFDDGLYTMGGITSNEYKYGKYLKYKFPAAVDESWLSPHLVYDLYEAEFIVLDSVLYTCTAIDEQFITPLGTFNCYVYHHREDQGEDVVEKLDIYEYYASNVGLVGVIIKGYMENLDGEDSYYKYKEVLYATNAIE